MPRKKGTPPAYDLKKHADLCDLIMQGVSISDAAKQVGVLHKTVQRYIKSDDDRYRQWYHDAIKIQADLFAGQCISIADNTTNETWQTARLQIDTRKWAVAKLHPERYSDKPQLVMQENNLYVDGTRTREKLSINGKETDDLKARQIVLQRVASGGNALATSQKALPETPHNNDDSSEGSQVIDVTPVTE